MLDGMNSIEQPGKSPFWTPSRIGLTAAALILVVAISSAVYHQDSPTESQVGTVGNPARNPAATPRELPADVQQSSFSLLSGQSRKLSDYAGKVLVLDLWATWCGPCRIEIPHLIQMAKDYKDKGVEVLGLTTEDPATDAQLVRDFSRKFEINYEIGWANSLLTREIMRGRNSIPQTLIIDRAGVVRKHFVGFHPQFSAPQMKAALDEIVAMD